MFSKKLVFSWQEIQWGKCHVFMVLKESQPKPNKTKALSFSQIYLQILFTQIQQWREKNTGKSIQQENKD